MAPLPKSATPEGFVNAKTEKEFEIAYKKYLETGRFSETIKALEKERIEITKDIIDKKPLEAQKKADKAAARENELIETIKNDRELMGAMQKITINFFPQRKHNLHLLDVDIAHTIVSKAMEQAQDKLGQNKEALEALEEARLLIQKSLQINFPELRKRHDQGPLSQAPVVKKDEIVVAGISGGIEAHNLPGPIAPFIGGNPNARG